MALAGIIVVGVALVAFSWTARDVQALSPTFGDHWHHGFGVYDCTSESFVPHLVDPQESNSGIHTHSDGVIHNHPASSTATGSGATLERFFEAVREDLTDDAVVFTDGTSVSEEGATCDGEPAILHAARFAPGATEPTEVITEDLGSMRLLNDQESYVIALVPEGADIPNAPADAIAQASASSPGIIRTDGLQDFDGGLHGADDGGAINVGGFNDDDVLVDGEGNPVLDADGNEITRQSIELQAEELQGESGDDADGEDDDG